jgi:pimeloyl-ACP methyl ester carboxylesterase
MPAAADFQFGPKQARAIRKPVLLVLGADSEALWPRFGETYRNLLTWLPQAEGWILPSATHALQMQNPRDLATALAKFFDRHQSGR